MMRAVRRIVWFLVWGAVACSQGLPDYDHYTDLRVLGMSAEPAAILANAPVPLATTFTALVVDPRGAPLHYTWTLCPTQSSQTCDDFANQLALLPAATQAYLSKLHALSLSGVATPSADANGVLAYNIAPFDIHAASTAQYGSDITAELYEYFLSTNFLGDGLGAWPSAVLTLQSDLGDVLYAQKRVVLGIADLPALASQATGGLGFNICPADGPPTPGCVPIKPAVPNHNPVFADVTVSFGQDGNGTFTAFAEPLPIRAGDSVLLHPTFTAASAETYQTLEGSLQDRTVQVVTRQEVLSVSWFTYAGTFRNALTWPLTKTLDNTYTAPGTPPPNGGAVTLWLVGRDQRGGEVWRSVRVQVIP